MQLIPVVSEQTIKNFGLIFEDPVIVDDVELKTGALNFGMSHDILSISSNERLSARRLQDHTDLIDPVFRLNQIFYRKTGQTEGYSVITVADKPGCKFVQHVPRVIQFQTSIDLKESLADDFSTVVTLIGSLHLETASLRVDAIKSNQIELLGYTICGDRVQVTSEKPPLRLEELFTRLKLFHRDEEFFGDAPVGISVTASGRFMVKYRSSNTVMKDTIQEAAKTIQDFLDKVDLVK